MAAADLSDYKSEIEVLRYWKVITRGLIALVTSMTHEDKEFQALLSESNLIENLDQRKFHHIIYFLLGLIDPTECNKRLTWPLSNQRARTEFRKSYIGILADLKEKHDWIKFSTNSDFQRNLIFPRGDDRLVLNLLMSLISLAVLTVCKDDHLPLPPQVKANDEAANLYKKLNKKKQSEIESNIISGEEFHETMKDLEKECFALKDKITDYRSEMTELRNLCAVMEMEAADTVDDVISALGAAFNAKHDIYNDDIREVEMLEEINSKALKVIQHALSPCVLSMPGGESLEKFSSSSADSMIELKRFLFKNKTDLSAIIGSELEHILKDYEENLVAEKEVIEEKSK